MLSTAMAFPLGVVPRHGPRCVPVSVDRTATIASSAMTWWSSKERSRKPSRQAATIRSSSATFVSREVSWTWKVKVGAKTRLERSNSPRFQPSSKIAIAAARLPDGCR